MSSQGYDVLDPSLATELFPLLARLRQEEPIYRSPQLQGVVVTRYADVMDVLRRPSLMAANTTLPVQGLSDAQKVELEPLITSLGRWFGISSAADHARIQSVFKRYFTPNMVRKMRPVAQELLDQRLDALHTDSIDLVSELAQPYPASVMGHMLGVPPGHEAEIQRWSRDIVAIFVRTNYEQLLASQDSLLEMEAFMRPLVAAHRQTPQDDILDVMIEAQAEGKMIDEDEIIANCSLLLFAGHETTARLLTHAMVALLTHPDQLAALREDPSLRVNAIDEVLRYDGPAGAVVRVPPSSVEIGGVRVQAGEPIFVCLAAANRDPEVFSQPDEFDIRRDNARKSLAFGTGAFYCLGAALARLEADVFFETMLRRFSTIEALDPTPAWAYSPPFNRGLESYRIRLTPALANH